jgi:GNAT superfamily N-acetyltransferase
VEVNIERLADLPTSLAVLVAESEQRGYRFVRRLADEWTSSVNRFDQPGEALFGAWAAGRLVGVCGLNIDPYATDGSIGRVRHLYVLEEFRRLGVGRRLMEAVMAAARGRFTLLRLRTEIALAAAFYEKLGFSPQAGVPACTHTLQWPGAELEGHLIEDRGAPRPGPTRREVPQ